MKNSNLLIVMAIAFITLQGCKKNDISCEDDLYLKVIARWPDMPKGLVKPDNITVYCFPDGNTGYTRTQIHTDGGNLSSEHGKNNLLFYNIQESDGITYENLHEYDKAEIILTSYEENGINFIREPYLLYGESFTGITFSKDTGNTLHYGPELLTHVVRFEIHLDGDKARQVIGCSGSLSGLSNRINLSTKRSGNLGYKIAFTAIKAESTYTKELLHFGYAGKNILELSFKMEDGEEKTAQLDISELVYSATPKQFNCRIRVFINGSGVRLDLSDVTIEAYKPGVNDSITIS